MFCPKCGTKAIDGAEFCQKCGTKLITDEPVKPSAEMPSVDSVQPTNPSQQPNPVQPPDPSPVNQTPKKKKSKRPVIIGAIIATVVLVAIVVVVLIWSGRIDYEAVVRAYTPYQDSADMPYTCGEVFDRYIPEAEWTVRESDGIHLVDIGGTLKGADQEALITIQMEVDEKMELVKMELVSLTLDGKKPEEDVFFALFAAYHEQDEDLSHFEELRKAVDFALRGGELTETFADEASGISFQYPDWWTIIDSSGEYEIVNMLDSRNTPQHTATLNVGLTLGEPPYGLFTGTRRRSRRR